MSDKKNYTVAKFPRIRQTIVESVSMDKYFNHLSGIFDADVTKALEIMKKYKEKTGEKLSFTAWFMKCLADATVEFPEIRTFRWRKWKTITFDDVDIKCMVDRIVNGVRVPIHYVFRNVDKKTFKELNDELRSVQEEYLERRKNERKQKRKQKILMKLPIWFRKRFIWPTILKNPFKHKFHFGIIGVSSVGMFGKGMNGWVIPKTMHQTQLLLGSITKKPIQNGDDIVFRDYFNITLTINHDIIDGGPAVEYTKRIAELLSNATGLEEFDI